ncbi:MAG: hypothetical protein WDW36_004506 [Sanguina aurantia]
MPQILPSPAFSPEQCVRVQMDALCNNDEPWLNHGIQTAYEFGNDTGGMERSVYSGKLADLYHFDHFLGRFGTMRGALVDAGSYEILQPTPSEAASPVTPVPDQQPTAACSASGPTSPAGSSHAASGSSPSEPPQQQQQQPPQQPQQQQQPQQHEPHEPPEQNPVVLVQIVDRQGDGAGVYRFELARRQYGQRRGSWTTLTLTKE